MPKGMPWDKWFFEDLDRDCGALSLNARGAWVWIIGDLRNHDGERTLNLEGWARVLRASIPQTVTVLTEIIQTKVCDSSVRADALAQKTDAGIDIRCRRIYREAKVRKQHNLRQQRYSSKRSNDALNDAGMTIEKQEARSKMQETPLSPSEKNGENNGNGNGGLSPQNMFLILWETYPAHRRGVKQQECLFEFAKLKPSKDQFGRILSAVDELKKSESWNEENGKYVPGLLKWIKSEGWRNVVIPEAPCKTCARTGVVCIRGDKLIPWTLERECEEKLPYKVCPDCQGKNRMINIAGFPNVKFS